MNLTTPSARCALVVPLLALLAIPLAAQRQPALAPAQGTWHFAVSGDSRNCGDVVMPSIAAKATAAGADFYWHLGDLRAIYDFDEDIVRRRQHKEEKPLTISQYEDTAWDDFIRNQIGPFGPMPVFLGIGNHETTPPKNREQFLLEFSDWLNSPVLRDQRLEDDPNDRQMKTYYHWIHGAVDFITLDNATPDQFSPAQVDWFEKQLARDQANPRIKTVVVGMHIPLPDSLADNHSMSQWPLGEQSGRRVYADLQKLESEGRKRVYVLASHQHFYMANVFKSEYWKQHGGVLAGWIIGTAGAMRYRLPADASLADAALANVYGFLLGTVDPDGGIRFEFQEVKESDVPPSLVQEYGEQAIHQCYAGNSQAR